jgi:beta-1,4-mannosyl-glycoprotein beta-1,4-N-acetylglucosaminyltransferase
MKIIDSFMFYNELDVLNIRLYEIYDIVDNIVLVESTKTHTGKPKELYYLNNKQISNFDPIYRNFVATTPLFKAFISAGGAPNIREFCCKI